MVTRYRSSGGLEGNLYSTYTHYSEINRPKPGLPPGQRKPLAPFPIPKLTRKYQTI